MSLPLGSLALLALSLLVGPTPQEEEDPLRFEEARVRRAWDTLWPSERHDVVEWLRLELSVQDSFQLQVVRYALGLEERDPGLWPVAEAAPLYDPATHAPRQPIPRRRLDPDSSTARRARRTFLGEPDPRALWRLWSYDWGRGELVRHPVADRSELLFENALNGYPPGLDLACALVARELDDGSERATLAAFGHAYSDRSGRVVPGVTLYDVWRSGKTFETPDVEALGIVHDVLDEWQRWRAPVSGAKQRALYDTLGELFQNARRHRGLREALADTYAMSAPPNADGYEASRHRLHALWEDAASEPERLAPRLPDARGWDSFLRTWDRQVAKDEELAAVAVGREYALARGEEQVRRTLVWVLREYGAFDRKRRPSTDPGAARTRPARPVGLDAR